MRDREQIRARRREQRKEIKDYIFEMKLESGGCACGEKDPAALDYHHVDPSDKVREINGRNRCLAAIKEEIKKCIVICANCHRKGHAGYPSPSHAQFFPEALHLGCT